MSLLILSYERHKKAVEKDSWSLKYVSDNLKTQEMCLKTVEKDICILLFIPDHFKTQKMCEKAVEKIHSYWSIFLNSIKLRRCITRWCRKYSAYWNTSPKVDKSNQDHELMDILGCKDVIKNRMVKKKIFDLLICWD